MGCCRDGLSEEKEWWCTELGAPKGGAAGAAVRKARDRQERRRGRGEGRNSWSGNTESKGLLNAWVRSEKAVREARGSRESKAGGRCD